MTSLRVAAEDVLVRHLSSGQEMTVTRAELRAHPDQYETIHNAFTEPSDLDIACAVYAAKHTTWVLPDFEHELPEFERAAQIVSVPTQDLVSAAKQSSLTTLSDELWAKMANTDSWLIDTVEKAIDFARMYDKDIRAVILGFGGRMETPIVLLQKDGTPMLVGGNTRLMSFRAFGLRPQILLVDISKHPEHCASGSTCVDRSCTAPTSVSEESRMSREVRAFQNAITVRNVAARFLSAMEHDTPEALKKYLKEHPDADKSNHTVKKKDDKGSESGGQFKDDAAYNKSVKQAIKVEGEVKSLDRLRDQVKRLHSYKHNDIEKAKEVSSKYVEKTAPIFSAAKDHIDHAAETFKKYFKHHGSTPRTEADGKWMSNVITRAEKDMESAKSAHEELSKRAKEDKPHGLDMYIDSTQNHLHELAANMKQLAAVLFTITGQGR